MGLFDDLLAGDGSQQPKAQSENTGSSINIDALPQGLKPYAKDFEEAGSKYGIDPNFLAAISWNETGGGTSKAFRSGNNAMGISNASGPLYGFNSVADSINRQAATLARPNGPYKGASTIQEIGSIYSPVGAANDPYHLNADWTGSVGNFYNKLTGRGNNAPVLGAGQQVAQPKTSGLFDDLLSDTNQQAQDPAQEQQQVNQGGGLFDDLLASNPQQAQSNKDASYLTSPSPTPEQAGKAINLPSYNPIENALRNFANTAATSTINSIGGAVRYFGGAQQKDLKMAQDELAQAKSSGASEDNLSEIQGRIDKIQSQLGSTKEASSSLSDLSSQYPAAYGVNPEDKSVSAQIGRGLGGVTAMLPIMSTGPAGMALGGLQGASTAYEDAYQQSVQNLKNQGMTDQSSIDDQAQKEASIAAVKTLPQLGVYMVGGKLASEGVSKLLSTQTPLIQGVAGAVAGSIANTAAGATIRKFMGENVMPTAESLTQDIAFGLFHGVGTGVEAQEKLRQQQQAKAKLDAAVGGPAPSVAPSSNPVVNEREAKINAMADAQYSPPLETTAEKVIDLSSEEANKPIPEEPVITPPDAITRLLTEQLFLDEGSEKWNDIQAQIDQLKASEAPAPAEVTTEEPPAEAPAEAQPTTENAVQESSAREVGVRNAPAVGEGVGEENKSEVPAQEGQAPKEEVAIITENTRTISRQYGNYPKGTNVEIIGEKSKDPLDQNIRVRFPDGKEEKFPISWLKKPKGQIATPKESLPRLVNRLGREGVNELLAEWQDAELSPDGKYIMGVIDPRSSMRLERVPVKEFLDWVQQKESTEQKPEVPTQEGKVTKEEVKPQEVQLTDEKQAEKVLLDKIDAEAGKPKAPKPKAPEVNPYKEILRRYESGEEDSINNPRDLVDEISKVARKQRNQYLKDAVERFHDAMDIGADVEPEIEKLLNEVKREGDRHEAPAAKKEPKRKTAKDKEMDVFGEGANGLRYVLDNKILDPAQYKRMVDAGIITGGGEYDFFYNSKLPKKVRDLIFSRTGRPLDIVAGDMGKTPHDLLVQIQEAYISAEKAKEDAKAIEQQQKAFEEQSRQMERLKKTNPKAYDKIAEEEARKLLNGKLRGEGAFFEFPDFIKDAAIKVGDAVRKGVTSFKDWSNGMIERLGEGVRDFLKDIWASVRDNWNKDIGGGFDTGGRSLERAAEEAKYAPKPPTEQEAFAKKAADAFLKGRGTPITEEEMSNILSRKFPGITSREVSDLYATATGKPKPPTPYAGVAAATEGQGEKISLKNQSAEAETKALGLPELTQQDEQEMNAAMDRAKATSAEDPMAGQRLAESLIADPKRSLTGDESALLLKHKTDLFNSLNKMAEGLTEGSPEQKFEKGLAYDNASKSYRDLLQAIKDRGSEWGREGRWRQALLHQDYTFATQERLATAAKRKPLTSNEKTKLAEETKRLTDIDKQIAENQEKEANKQEQRKAEQEIKKAPEVDPYIQSLVDRITKNVSSAADAARERIAQRRKERAGRLFTGVDFDRLADIPDATIIGADYLIKGTSKFADWSSKMIGEFGEKIRPYLDDIFKKSKEFNEQQVDKESKGSKSTKKRITKAVSPEERIRRGQETRARNRLEELKKEEERQKNGDFSKPVKKAPIEPSEETKRLRIEAQKIKDRIDKRRSDFEKANRPAVNKVLDAISALNRFNILSHITVLEHLVGAAVENIVTRPVSSTLAQLFRFNKTLNEIRRKAIYEGGLSAKSELKGVFGIVTSAKDVLNKLLKGKTDIDWLYGGKNNYAPSFVRAVENIHGAMKEPVRQGIFSRSLQLRIDAAEKQGQDPTNDEVLYHALASEAVNDANMDIFMGDNFITRGIRGLMKGFETNKQSPRLGKFVSALMDIAMPVMNVPTNIAIRKMRLAGGLFESATRIGIAAKEGKLANGAEALTNQEAEQIMRAFKYGTLGLAIGAYAWTHSNQFGGIINNVGPNAPENKDLKKGEMELGGIKIARPLGHGPVATYMNMVADARRMYDKSVRNNPNSKWSSLSEPAFFSMFVSGLGSMPPAQAATRFFSPFTTAGQKLGQTVRDMLINGAVQDVAAKMDTNPQPKNFIDFLEAEPIKRSPKTFEQEIMKGVPGLRNKLPASKPRGSSNGSSGSSSRPWYEQSSKSSSSKPWYEKK